MDRKTKFKAGCGLLGVFGAGFLCGAVALFVFLVRIIPLSEGWRDEESKEFVTDHLATLGAFAIPRREYCRRAAVAAARAVDLTAVAPTLAAANAG
jgi:hypothetical protein